MLALSPSIPQPGVTGKQVCPNPETAASLFSFSSTQTQHSDLWKWADLGLIGT